MSKTKFSLKKRFISFKYAFNGLKILIKEEHNARIHLLATIAVVSLGFVFKISNIEWMLTVFAIGFVVVSEIFNSAIENLSDFMTKETNPQIKRIKDLAAAGVLISAITALIIGLIIFIPKIIEL